MRVILGTYRGPVLVHRALESLAKLCRGITAVTIVDDSGNDSWVEHYEQLMIHMPYLSHPIQPHVIALPRQGYNAAMQAVTRQGALEDRFLWWEEDFTLTQPTDLADLVSILNTRPYLAQIALQRGPWFPVEHQHGGLLQGLSARIGAENVQANVVHTPVEHPSGSSRLVSVVEQIGTFTCNPSVWQRGIAAKGWPTSQWSEDAFTRQLVHEGYKFGMLPDISIVHDGVRSGYGY